MTPSSSLETHQNSLKTVPQSNHELTQIRGIGSVRRRLLQAMQIQTIAQLANQNPIDIEEKLKAIGHAISASEIAAWITKAQELQRQEINDSRVQKTIASPENLLEKEACDPNRPPNSSILGGTMLLDRPNPVNQSEVNPPRSNSWQSVASFRLELQQRSINGQLEWRSVVHQVENSAIVLQAAEAMNAALSEISASATPAAKNLPEPAPFAENALSAMPLPKRLLSLSVTRVRLWKNSQTSVELDRQQRSIGITAETPFDLEVGFTADSQDDRANAGIPPADPHCTYHLECRVKHLGTGKTFCLGDLQANVPLCRSGQYSAVLHNLSFPMPGVYRVQICLTSETTLPALFKVPFLEVDAA